jgi:hypothetical protein
MLRDLPFPALTRALSTPLEDLGQRSTTAAPATWLRAKVGLTITYNRSDPASDEPSILEPARSTKPLIARSRRLTPKAILPAAGKIHGPPSAQKPTPTAKPSPPSRPR